MASLFAITTATDKLKAETGSASTVFTVTNSTSRPLRGIVKVKPLGNTQAQWLKIDGETERDFPAGGTHQFTVSFNRPKPPAAPNTAQPAESFPFRLDTISATNPDEDFTEGPTVTVEIPEQKVEEKKPFPWLLLAIGAAVFLIVAGVGIWLAMRNPGVGAEVPDVKGQNIAEAQKALTDQKFIVETVEEEAPKELLDVVFKQEPVGKVETAPEDTTVKLTVPGKVMVPDVRTKTLDDAIKTLQKNGLKLGTITGESDAIKNGQLTKVESHTPPAPETVHKGTEVNLKFPCRSRPMIPRPGQPFEPQPGKKCIDFTMPK